LIKESAARQDSVRIPPLSIEEFTDEQKVLVGEWHHLNFSRVLVQHPGMYRAFLPFLDKVIRGSNLPPRDREILCLRTLALGGDVYEAHHHVTIARKAGMTEAEIEAAQTGGMGLTQFDHCLVRAAEEVVRQQCVSDQTWACLAERYSREPRSREASGWKWSGGRRSSSGSQNCANTPSLCAGL
jgi:4-carboxymuconolactone decarboxylase